MPGKSFKNYSQCIDYLFNLERGGIKYDLSNITTLLNHLRNPENSFRTIHVAGTNGKGSVCAMLNSLLIVKKIRTGLYTSPHISDFRERILVNGSFISKKFIVEFTRRLKPLIEKIKPSFFEVTTAMAFDYFRYKKIQYAVIEAGLGGRLDSTNVVKPVLTIISSIAIDHVEFLGNTLDKIASEKAGIIKKNVPVIIGNVPSALHKLFRSAATKKHSEIVFANKSDKINITGRHEKGMSFKHNNHRFTLPLIGDYQTHNLLTFFSAIKILGKEENMNFKVSEIRRALNNIKSDSRFSGRFELLRIDPKVIIDVSHNLQAIKNIKANLQYFRYRKLIIIFGMMHDKNFSACLNELSKIGNEIILTRPDYKRSASTSALLESVVKRRELFHAIDELSSAVKYAFETSRKNDLILVTGSFYLAGDFIKLIGKLK